MNGYFWIMYARGSDLPRVGLFKVCIHNELGDLCLTPIKGEGTGFEMILQPDQIIDSSEVVNPFNSFKKV